MTIELGIFITAILMFVGMLIMNHPSKYTLEDGERHIRKDVNGEDVHLNITKGDKLISCHAYREIKQGKFKAIHHFQSDLWDSRIEEYLLISNLTLSNREERVNSMLFYMMEKVNEDLAKREQYKEVMNMFEGGRA